MGDDRFQIPNYPDMIVIPFRIPPGMIAPRSRRTAQPHRDRVPADEFAGASPRGTPDGRASPAGVAPDMRPASASGRGPPAVELVVAGVRGHAALVVSGFSDGPLTLYRRDNDQPPRALASFTADLDGSFWAADGKFLGRLVADQTALFDPDWLRSIGAGQIQLVGDAPDEGAEPENPAQRELEKEFRHLEQQLQPLGGAGPPSPGEQRPAPVVQPPIPIVPSPGPSSRPGQAAGQRGEPEPGGIAPPQLPGRSGSAASPRPVPLGFPNPESFASFGRQLYAGLNAAGYPDVYAAVRGSAVTGESFRTRAPFDAGRRSDLDVALVSPSLLQTAKDLRIGLRSGGHRTGPLKDNDLRELGLPDLARKLSQRVNRAVSIMIYDSPSAIEERGSNVPIPR